MPTVEKIYQCIIGVGEVKADPPPLFQKERRLEKQASGIVQGGGEWRLSVEFFSESN